MTPRVGAILLIAVLLCGGWLRAAERAAAPSAELVLRRADPAQLDGLRALAAKLHLRVRVLAAGATVRLELSAASREQLAAGLRRLRRVIEAGGDKADLRRAGATEPVRAVSHQSTVPTAPRTGGPSVPPGVAVPRAPADQIRCRAAIPIDAPPTPFQNPPAGPSHRGPPV